MMLRALLSRSPLRLSATPRLEALEDRAVPSANVLQTNLVSDLPGVAAVTDPNLVNPWGISQGPGGPFWISDNNAGLATLYDVPGANNTPVDINSLVVSIPTPGDPLGASGTPTGTVFNLGRASGAFQVTGVNKAGQPASAPAIFLFATEDGTLVGWNPGINPVGFDPAKAGTYGIILKDNSGNNFTEPNPDLQTGAVYKGLTIATSSTPIFKDDPNSTSVLYVSNFRTGQVEVYDSQLQRVMLPMGAFTDSNLPRGYAPFNVQVLGDKVYVTYALQNEAKHDDVAGPGHGFVDVFNLNGTPAGPNGGPRLISRGQLDSPWGLAIAPSSFGSLAGSLLVGNFGNGRINAFNPDSGAFLDTLRDPDGEPIQIDGLWALKVGTNTPGSTPPGKGGDPNTVYFTAGLFGETHGLFGSLAPVAAGTPEGQAEAQEVTAALDVFQLQLTVVQKDLAGGVTGAQLRQDLRTLNADLVALIRAEIRFAVDARADAGLTGSMHHGHHGLDDLFAELGDR
jgi:uncharacterized protein (TIGR03118 family)